MQCVQYQEGYSKLKIIKGKLWPKYLTDCSVESFLFFTLPYISDIANIFRPLDNTSCLKTSLNESINNFKL